MANAISKRRALQRRRRRRRWGVGLLGLALAGGIWQWGLPYLLGLPCWIVEEVDLGTCPPALRPAVAERIGAFIGQPIYRIWWQRSRIVAEVEALPRIRTARLHLGWPNRVALAIAPRQPLFVVSSGGKYYPVDQEGILLEKAASPPPSLPLVWGLAVGSKRAGEPLPPSAVQPVLDCLAAARERQVEVAHLIWLKDQTLQLHTAQNEQVRLGPNRELSRKLGLFVGIRKELQRQGQAFEYVDVSVPEVPAWKPRGTAGLGWRGSA